MFIEDLISSPITLILSITSIILSLLINFQLIDNFQLYFDKKLIFESHQYYVLDQLILTPHFRFFSLSDIYPMLKVHTS